MDRMIFCNKCKVEEMVDDYYSDEWKCPKCNQPERLNPGGAFEFNPILSPDWVVNLKSTCDSPTPENK